MATTAAHQHWSNPLPPLPRVSWEEIERVLQDLTTIPSRRAFLAPSIQGIAKTAPFKPPQMVWRELAILIWIVLDETPVAVEPEPDDEEAPMP